MCGETAHAQHALWQSRVDTKMNSVWGSMQVLVVCHDWHRASVSAGDAKWSQVVPRESSIEAMGRGIPTSLITEGRLCMETWENPEVGTVSDLLCEQSFHSAVLQTSAVLSHSHQRAKPQFQACKHSETSETESVIFPLRIFQMDILKQTPSCCRPHPWPLELWPLHVHICASLKRK